MIYDMSLYEPLGSAALVVCREERLVTHLEDHALLRVHDARLRGRDAEHLVVEEVHALHHRDVPHVERGGGIDMYIDVCLYTSIYMYVYVYICIYIHIYICIHTYIYMYVCMYI